MKTEVEAVEKLKQINEEIYATEDPYLSRTRDLWRLRIQKTVLLWVLDENMTDIPQLS